MIWALWVSDPYIPPFDPCHSLPLPPLPHPNLHLDRYGGHDARSPEACRLGGWWQPGEAGTPAPQDDLGGAAAAPHGQGSGPLPAPRRFIFPRFIFIFLCLFVCLFVFLADVCLLCHPIARRIQPSGTPSARRRWRPSSTSSRPSTHPGGAARALWRSGRSWAGSGGCASCAPSFVASEAN